MTPATAMETITPEVARSTSTPLKVSAHTRPGATAGAIAAIIRAGEVAEIQSIGAAATNQAVKAIAIARNYLHDEQIRIVCIPSFVDLMIDGEERTAIRLHVERRAPTMRNV